MRVLEFLIRFNLSRLEILIRLGVILYPRGHSAISGDNFDCHNVGLGATDISRYRPGMLLHFLDGHLRMLSVLKLESSDFREQSRPIGSSDASLMVAHRERRV